MKRGINLTQQWHFGSWLFEGWPQFPFFRQNLSAQSRLSTASTECKEFNHKSQSVVQSIKKTKKLKREKHCCYLCVLEGWQKLHEKSKKGAVYLDKANFRRLGEAHPDEGGGKSLCVHLAPGALKWQVFCCMSENFFQFQYKEKVKFT